jgi:adenosine/AMP kinase
MIERAKRNALALSAGHSFVIFLGPGYFPCQCAKRHQDGARSLPGLLLNGESR